MAYFIAQSSLFYSPNHAELENDLYYKPTGTKSKRTSDSDSQETSTKVQWVPSKYTPDVTQYVLIEPSRAPCGNRWLFGFPLIKKELWDMGTIAFKQLQPDEPLPDNNAFIAMIGSNENLADIAQTLAVLPHLHHASIGSGKYSKLLRTLILS
ncbi:uncharacterized protein F5891DRAFT_983469 [Suillus fuscotomentosus]|uniref:Uncharacterized protein n=1 Tax=Suillus fuscotomentosus TaxID=1912939 RepID=A0AAD4HI89_9AGAM|nr:uncharacterized protein F5891DRAFT_983469 [Suillus fuscotomentosus]KAG1896474.1 hypothetical protein F5891DRAFT_983469 [Suillus fuscotomentosus]